SNRSECWTKPSNCDADVPLLDAGGNNGPMEPIALASFHQSPLRQADGAHGSDGMGSHIRTMAQQI
ncbi:hypothetical protein TNCV_1984901, partial [Trichonephila clavipes]